VQKQTEKKQIMHLLWKIDDHGTIFSNSGHTFCECCQIFVKNGAYLENTMECQSMLYLLVVQTVKSTEHHLPYDLG